MFLKPEYFKPVATIWEALGYPVPKASSQGGPDVERMKHGANRCAYSISPVFLKDTTYMPFEAFAMRQEYEDRQADSGSEGEGDEDQEIDWIRDDSSSSSSDPGYYAGPGGYVPHLDWEITIDTGERTPLEGLELGDEEVEIEDAIEGGSAHETISPAPSSQEAEEDTFVPVGQGTEQPETPISPGTWERWVIGEWERHARDQRDLSNRLVRRRAQASVKPRAPSVPLENGDEAEPVSASLE